jgi:AraC-like DNA-binding protein
LRFSLAFASEPAPLEPSRYEKSGLDNNAACAISEKLQKLMVQDKPYLDPDLKIASLAQQLDVSVHHLSQVINSDNAAGKGRNFYDFVNSYRIREVLAMFDDPGKDQENILNIAFDSGFTSKATFNRVFKKQTGKTPLEYRQANRQSE